LLKKNPGCKVNPLQPYFVENRGDWYAFFAQKACIFTDDETATILLFTGRLFLPAEGLVATAAGQSLP
jgi:hypothetical protein